MAVLLLILACALLSALPQTARADSPVLVLDGPARDTALQGHIDFHREQARTLQPQDFAGPNAIPMDPVTKAWPDFGYTPDRIWLRLDLQNDTDTTEWRLHFRENFKQEFAVFALRADGRVDTLYDIDRTSRFSDRAIAYPEMVAPLSMQPGETVTLVIRYMSEGNTYLAFGIETLESFSQIANLRIAKGYIFYGMVLLLITVALIALALFRHRVFASYAAYAVAALLYIMHGDGVAFQLLWPNWPGFNSMASVVTGSGIIVFGAIYARVFLETPRYHPVLDKVLVAIIATTLLLDIVLWVPNPQLLKLVLVAFSMLAIITFAVSGIIAARTRFREVRFYVLAWVGLVASAAFMNGRHLFGIEISQDVQYDSMRAALVFDALMMGLGIADRYNTLRKSRRKALNTALEQARENSALAVRLAQLGERYDQARSLARGQIEMRENTAHDVRQPMQALRLTLRSLDKDGLSKHERREKLQTFEASITYMEQLIDHWIDDSPPIEPATDALPDPEAQPKDMSAHAVLQSIQQMFAADAMEKGLDLRLRLGPTDRPVAAFALMRVVNNLVANALKFTQSGAVLIACSASDRGLRIEVHDTGPGLSADAFEQARTRHVRLGGPAEYETEGSGLGLAIADKIALQEGWSLKRVTWRKAGTGIALQIPQ